MEKIFKRFKIKMESERKRIIHQLNLMDKAAGRPEVKTYNLMSTELLREKLNRLIDEDLEKGEEEEVDEKLQAHLNLYKFLLSYMVPTGFMANLTREKYDVLWSKLFNAYPEVVCIFDKENTWKLLRQVIDQGESNGWSQFGPMLQERNRVWGILQSAVPVEITYERASESKDKEKDKEKEKEKEKRDEPNLDLSGMLTVSQSELEMFQNILGNLNFGGFHF